MQLTNKENSVFWNKEIDITLTVCELQIIRDCIATNNYINATEDYDITFNENPPYKDCDLSNLYHQTQKILKSQGGYVL